MGFGWNCKGFRRSHFNTKDECILTLLKRNKESKVGSTFSTLYKMACKTLSGFWPYFPELLLATSVALRPDWSWSKTVRNLGWSVGMSVLEWLKHYEPLEDQLLCIRNFISSISSLWIAFLKESSIWGDIWRVCLIWIFSWIMVCTWLISQHLDILKNPRLITISKATVFLWHLLIPDSDPTWISEKYLRISYDWWNSEIAWWSQLTIARISYK